MTDNYENNDVNAEPEIPEKNPSGKNPPEEKLPEEEKIPEEEKLPEEEYSDDTLAKAITESADLKDRLLRAVAETENLRRRADREKSDAANYAITAFARDLLSVGDNLRRALDSIPADADLGQHAKTLVDGIEMTERDLLNMLERHNIKKIDPIGEKFSHDRHQALFEVPDTGKENGTIVQVMQVGYVIKDRLLRPAMVGVARSKKAPAAEHVDTKV